MFTHLFVLNRKYGIQAHCTNTKIKTKNWKGEETNMERADRRKKRRFFNVQNGTNRENPVFYIGLSSDYMAFLLQQLIFYRPLWWQSVPDLPYGELSIFWKDTEMITVRHVRK